MMARSSAGVLERSRWRAGLDGACPSGRRRRRWRAAAQPPGSRIRLYKRVCTSPTCRDLKGSRLLMDRAASAGWCRALQAEFERAGPAQPRWLAWPLAPRRAAGLKAEAPACVPSCLSADITVHPVHGRNELPFVPRDFASRQPHQYHTPPQAPVAIVPPPVHPLSRPPAAGQGGRFEYRRGFCVLVIDSGWGSALWWRACPRWPTPTCTCSRWRAGSAG